MNSQTIVIPTNYTDSGKLFGMFEKRNAIETVCLALPVIFLIVMLSPFSIHAIIEHCNFECSEGFDHDNKGFKAVQNALKGRLFPDDDQFELSLGLFTVLDPEMSCHIYIMPESDASDFMFQKLAGEV
ncbi:MAG: hypothetical protein PUB00_04815 [Clostridiales bacterium]|nr:hypothetical protein [Clostridiales bacterium]